MTAKLTWASSDEMSLTNMNAMVDGLKQSGVLLYSREDLDQINPAATYPTAPHVSIPIRPVQGQCLVVRYYSHHDGGAGTFTVKFELECFGVREALDEFAETDTSDTYYERVFDFSTLTTIEPGGFEAKLNIYVKRSGGTYYHIGYFMVATGDSTTPEEYLGDVE